MSINVQLPKFEGPLGLLLYLIRKEEMDIMDIKIHDITKQYLDYIKLMKELDLEVAGEFVAMASTLIHIKSRMLLPQYNENGEVVEQEDPRKELVQKLLEYQKYQEASKLLYERPLVGRDVWLRGVRESLQPQDEEIVLEENALFSLISTYRGLLRSGKKKTHQVTQKTQSISSRILEIKDLLPLGRQVTMMDLITTTEDRPRQVLITFLSLLELGKMEFVKLWQTDVYTEIWAEAQRAIEGDILSRVEEYDSLHADEVAEKMMARAKKEEAEQADDDFLLSDAEDNPQMSLVATENHDELADPEELASDDEIMAAEADLAAELAQESGHGPDQEI